MLFNAGVLRNAAATAGRSSLMVARLHTARVSQSSIPSSNPSILRFTKLFNQAKNNIVQRGYRTAVHEGVAARPSLATLPRNRLVMATGAAGGILLLGLAGSQAARFTPQSLMDAAWSPLTQSRVRQTFASLGMGVAATGVAAAAFFRAGLAHRVAGMGLMGMLGMMAVTTGTAMAVRMVDPDNKALKMGSWLLLNASVGLTLSPLVVLGGPLLLRAAAITGGIVGSLAFVAANSPSDQFLSMGGPLAMGLGAVVVSSLGAAFFPAAAAAPLLMKVSLYGGLFVFSGFVLYDTSIIVNRAKVQQRFDPVGECVGLYFDAINIFIRIVQILMMSGSNRRK